MYIFYGLEIPKSWEHWPSAFGNCPLNIQVNKLEVDVPNVGGEPVLMNGKAVNVQGFELTLYRYPHDVEDNPLQENLGVFGYLICELDPYTDPTAPLKRYQEWQQKYATISNFDNTLQQICKGFDFNFIKPKILTCATECGCCV